MPDTSSGQSLQRVSLERAELPYEINEEMKTLRTNLQFCGTDKRVVLFTSSISGEGKSTTVLNLCRAFADQGKSVLLLDADLRKSVLNRKVVHSGRPSYFGLSHYLSGQCEMNSIIYETDTPGMAVIFAGFVPPNPAELLSGERMAALLAATKKAFDYVLVDCAPLGMVVDAAIVAPLCDGAVIEIEAGTIKYRLAQEVVSKMQNTRCPILGVVLNKVDRRKSSKYYGKYYGRYYGKRYEEYYK